MAEMLMAGANELDQVTAIDSSMLNAIKTLAPLFGGGTVEQSRPPLSVGRTSQESGQPIQKSLPTPPLSEDLRRDILFQYKSLTSQGMEKVKAFMKIHELYPSASRPQIAGLCNQVERRKAAAVLQNSN